MADRRSVSMLQVKVEPGLLKRLKIKAVMADLSLREYVGSILGAACGDSGQPAKIRKAMPASGQDAHA